MSYRMCLGTRFIARTGHISECQGYVQPLALNTWVSRIARKWQFSAAAWLASVAKDRSVFTEPYVCHQELTGQRLNTSLPLPLSPDSASAPSLERPDATAYNVSSTALTTSVFYVCLFKTLYTAILIKVRRFTKLNTNKSGERNAK